jgi:hypothetical protein
MANQLGPLEICCDAPIYPVVQACNMLGMQTPEDVPWHRMSHFLNSRAGWRNSLILRPWQIIWETGMDDKVRCRCREKLPALAMYTFTFSTGKEVSYFLGQCRRCHAIYWEQA